MPATCDCGTCCDPCGHLPDCLRWALLPADDRALALAEDGYPTTRRPAPTVERSAA